MRRNLDIRAISRCDHVKHPPRIPSNFGKQFANFASDIDFCEKCVRVDRPVPDIAIVYVQNAAVSNR
jgi:hypothetical protein